MCSLAIVDGYSNSINSFLSLECQTSHLNSDLGLTQSAISAQFTSCAGVGMYNNFSDYTSFLHVVTR